MKSRTDRKLQQVTFIDKKRRHHEPAAPNFATVANHPEQLNEPKTIVALKPGNFYEACAAATDLVSRLPSENSGRNLREWDFDIHCRHTHQHLTIVARCISKAMQKFDKIPRAFMFRIERIRALTPDAPGLVG